MNAKIKNAIQFLVLFILTILLRPYFIPDFIATYRPQLSIYMQDIITSSLLLFVGVIFIKKPQDAKSVLKFLGISIISSILIRIFSETLVTLAHVFIKDLGGSVWLGMITNIIGEFVKLILWGLMFLIICKEFKFEKLFDGMKYPIIISVILCVIIAFISQLDNYVMYTLLGEINDVFKLFELLGEIYNFSGLLGKLDIFVRCMIMFVISTGLLKNNEEN